MTERLGFVITEDRPPDVSLRAWRREIVKPTNEDIGDYWHEKIFPRHFKPGAAQKYKHSKRTPGYLKKKEALARRGIVKRVSGQIQDNVFTGRMRADLKRSRIVRGYPTRVTIKMMGPRYVTMRVYKSNQPDKAAELSYITADEEKELAAYGAERLQHHMATHRTTKRVTKG